MEVITIQPTIVSDSYLVPESLLTHPLYNDWCNRTFNQIKTAKSDLEAAIKNIIPIPENVEITAYLYSLLRIANTLS